MQSATLSSLPTEILTLVHSSLLQTDPTLRSCLALEATCEHLRALLISNARFEDVRVEAGHLATAQEPGSFWGWIAAHGSRIDMLRLKNLELRHATPQLCSHAGVLQARAVNVSAAVVDTLETLRGLLNLAAVQHSSHVDDADGDVSLQPLAGLPALEHVDLGQAISNTTSLAPLRNMASLTSLKLRSFDIPQLDDLASLSKLRELSLAGFHHVTSVAPISCLTSLTNLAILSFPLLDSLVPLGALSRLQHLSLGLLSSRVISLGPLCQLPALTALFMQGDMPDDMPDYDLQPLSVLSRTLQVLHMADCVLRNMPAIGSLSMTLRQLSFRDCTCQPGFQLASLIPQLPGLLVLSISDATAADLDAIGQHLHGLLILKLTRTDTVTSLAALVSLTRLTFISLESCTHISNIDPLTALTRLETVHLRSCPHLASLSPLTALGRLRQLRLEGCPQLAVSLPTTLQPLLTVTGPGM